MVREFKETGSIRNRECACVRRNGEERTVLLSGQSVSMRGSRSC